MNLGFVMRLRTQLDTNNIAVINGAQGYDEVVVDSVDGGFALFIGGVQIAIGIGSDPLEASEDLLDRAADLFYHSTPEA